jgi:hypothetical protein
MVMLIIIENKTKNPIPVRVLNIAFDFCFRRVTEEGYTFFHPSKRARLRENLRLFFRLPLQHEIFSFVRMIIDSFVILTKEVSEYLL